MILFFFFNLLLGKVGMVRDLTNKRITERAVRNYAVLPAEFLQTKLYKNIKNMKRFWREVEQTQDTQSPESSGGVLPKPAYVPWQLQGKLIKFRRR